MDKKVWCLEKRPSFSVQIFSKLPCLAYHKNRFFTPKIMWICNLSPAPGAVISRLSEIDFLYSAILGIVSLKLAQVCVHTLGPLHFLGHGRGFMSR